MSRHGGKWHLYILKCGDGTLYTGVSLDVERRLSEHRKGSASKYTRSRQPVRLVHQEACEGRGDALRKERSVKKLTRQEKEEIIKGKWTKRR